MKLTSITPCNWCTTYKKYFVWTR